MMATRTRKVEAEEETNGSKDVYRLSITIDPSIRRKIRIASAVRDMSPGEWAAAVLERAADKVADQLSAVEDEE